jgi:hypothetical protein
MVTNRTTMALVILLGLLEVQDALAFYNPQTGRWLNRDPIGEKGGRNLYAHTRNRPTISWDRLGHSDATSGVSDGASTAEGDATVFQFGGAAVSASVVVEFDGDTICRSRAVTVTATFETFGGTDDEYRDKSFFYCDGEQTSPAKGTDWGATKVVIKCKKSVQFCGDGDKKSGVAVKGVYAPSPTAPDGDGSAAASVKWSYNCNTCCELEKPFSHSTSWVTTGGVHR